MARKIGSRYTAHQILGRGSAGTVWLGEGPEGPVAIKLLREDLASDQELVGRFVQERTALLGLDHPHVVGVRDLVVDGNDLALVMDLVRGTDLRTRLDRERRLAPEAAVAIAADVADGLAAAHAAGIVHRDVKPENVLLDMQGPLGPGGAHPALLTDFGVAKLDRLPAPDPGHEDHRHARLPRARDRRGPAAARRRRHLRARDRPVRAARGLHAVRRRAPGRGPAPPCHRDASSRCPASPTSCGSCCPVPGQGARLPAARLRAGRPAARAAAAPGRACRRWTSTSRTRSSRGRAGGRRRTTRSRTAPAPPGEAAPRAARSRSCQGAAPDSNRDTHTSMRVPGAGRAGGRRARHRPRPARRR